MVFINDSCKKGDNIWLHSYTQNIGIVSLVIVYILQSAPL